MPSWVIVGPGDDAAVFAPARGALQVVTVDALVEGVHFDRSFTSPEAIGHRALAINLSDLAAMGSEPVAALLSLALPEQFEIAALDGLLDGFLALASVHRVTLLGGNITRTSGPLVIDVTAFGSVRPRRILSRAGARPGDAVYVTGSLGSAAIGLRMLSATRATTDTSGQPVDAQWTPATERYLHPSPRVLAGLLLGRNRAASSCMDCSDGLADALRQVAEASGVGMLIDGASVPMAEDVHAWHRVHGGDPLHTAFSGGDDYELLFTVRPSHRGRLRGVQQQVGDLSFTRIGVVTKSRDLLVKRGDQTTVLPQGYEHFR